MNPRHPLLTRYPGLATKLVPGRLRADLPTPLQQFGTLDPALWVKRDDLTGAGYGGNKTRKLEFVLPYAMARGARRIVTVGGLGTHHGLATAIACKQLGLACEILLFDQPVTEHVRENLYLMHHHGARLRYCHSMPTALAAYALHPLRLDKRSYFLFAGASNPVGTTAYVNAALELDIQISAQQIPTPRAIYCAVGSTGTLAGLTLGLALCGRDIPVIGVRVIDSHLGPFAACTPATVAKLMRKTLVWLRDLDKEIPPLAPPEPLLIDSYFGDGYGAPSVAGNHAAERAHSAGLTLDPTYTAKAFAAALDGIQQNNGPIIYWHTLASANLGKALTEAQKAPVPSTIKRLINN